MTGVRRPARSARRLAIAHRSHMSIKSIETPKASSRPDDLIKPKTKDGKTELTELSEQELGQVSGGMKVNEIQYK